MPSTVQKIIAGLKQETRQKRFDAYSLMFELARSEPARIGELLIAVMRDFPKGGTFANDAVSYLPLADFPAVVTQAMLALESSGPIDAAQDILAHCSLQFPQALHPHLETILRLRPNGSTYCADWPWRESGASEFKALKAKLGDIQTTADERSLILDAMLETRDPKMMRVAMKSRSPLTADPLEAMLDDKTKAHVHDLLAELKRFAASSPPENKVATKEQTHWDLRDVGFEERARKIHRLYPGKAWHLVFERAYLRADEQPLVLQKQHPTWHLQGASDHSSLFGGPGTHQCAVCHVQGHHMVTLDPVPGDLGVTGMKRLTLETCLSCLGWEEGVLFYDHGKDRPPSPMAYAGKEHKPQFPAQPLKETRVRLSPTPPRWFWQDWARSNDRQNLNRLGGHPCWVQGPAYPRCPGCRQTMHFLLQLDSCLPTADDEEFLWGSGGLAYAFWCDDCQTSAFQWQCT